MGDLQGQLPPAVLVVENKVKKKLFFSIAGILLSIGAVLSCSDGLEERIEVVIGGESFRIEVARSDELKRQGLMNRRSIGDREGMIFVYETDQHLAFWMKNTTIPLTLAYLSKDGRIMQIEELKPLSLLFFMFCPFPSMRF